LKRGREGSLPAAEVDRFDVAAEEEVFCALNEKDEWLYDMETA
jgi:hypothetical protein